tara:strand:- start:48 stop:389 length:342 start_codon:yes stop_codon:yes gene_type:complete
MSKIIEVNVEGEGNCIAKIVEECENGNFMVKYLSPYNDSEKMYKYEKKRYEVEPEMVSIFHDTDGLVELGYTQIERNLFEKDSESDYDPSTEEEEDSDDEECVDSDEELVDDE